jgi:hypothetical protein
MVSTQASLQKRTLPYPCDPDIAVGSQGHASAGRLIPTILGASPLDW